MEGSTNGNITINRTAKVFQKNVEQVAQDAMLISEKEYVLSLSLIQMMKL